MLAWLFSVLLLLYNKNNNLKFTSWKISYGEEYFTRRSRSVFRGLFIEVCDPIQVTLKKLHNNNNNINFVQLVTVTSRPVKIFDY